MSKTSIIATVFLNFLVSLKPRTLATTIPNSLFRPTDKPTIRLYKQLINKGIAKIRICGIIYL